MSAALAANAQEQKYSSFDDLSFDQKLGQTLFAFTDMDNAHKYKSAIEKGLVGGVLIQWGNYEIEETAKIIKKMQSWAEKSPHKLPLLISIDYEGGTVYTPVTLGLEYLPTNMMIAAANDENAAARLFYLAGRELKKTGIHINFAPAVDVNVNAGNPIIGVRSFGSDPAKVGRMGAAVVHGLEASGVMSVAKHFPGHGDTSTDSHYTLPVLNISKEDMYKIHLAPFRDAIKAGVPGVMTSHIVFKSLDPKEASTYSKIIIGELLKKEMGFKGIVVSDALDMRGAMAAAGIKNGKGTAEDGIALSVAKTIEAGTDIALLGRMLNAEKTFSGIKSHVGTTVSEKRIEESAKKVYELKKQLGLFDPKDESEQISSLKAYSAAAEDVAVKAVTLLRNKDNYLPLSQELTTDVDRKRKLCTVFFAPTRFAEQIVSFNQPFLEAGIDVQYYNAPLSPKSKDAKRVKECSDGADFVVMGSLQWAHKPNARQASIITDTLKEHPNTILISMMSPYDVMVYKDAKTVLLTYGISRYAMKAAADIILGNIEPKGTPPVDIK
ncbi:beta-N-acetylhexosaminidase [Parelusimicrobium proximum]